MTEEELNLIRWYVAQQLSVGLKEAVMDRYMDEDDLVQDGALYFLRFPPADGVNRSTALCRAAKWAVLKRLRYLKRKKRNFGVWEKDLTEHMLDYLQAKDTEEPIDFVDLTSLTSLQRETICRVFGIGREQESVNEIAKKRRVTMSTVSSARCSAIIRLRRLVKC